MVYFLGNCPKCKARLLLDYVHGNNYNEIDVDGSTITLTFYVKCWKCGAVVKSEIASNIDEVPMLVKVVKRKLPYIILDTKDLSKYEEPKEGWAWVSYSRRNHYFRNKRSLCGKWDFPLSAPLKFDQNISLGNTDNCFECERRLARENQIQHNKEVREQEAKSAFEEMKFVR